MSTESELPSSDTSKTNSERLAVLVARACANFIASLCDEDGKFSVTAFDWSFTGYVRSVPKVIRIAMFSSLVFMGNAVQVVDPTCPRNGNVLTEGASALDGGQCPLGGAHVGRQLGSIQQLPVIPQPRRRLPQRGFTTMRPIAAKLFAYRVSAWNCSVDTPLHLQARASLASACGLHSHVDKPTIRLVFLTEEEEFRSIILFPDPKLLDDCRYATLKRPETARRNEVFETITIANFCGEGFLSWNIGEAYYTQYKRVPLETGGGTFGHDEPLGHGMNLDDGTFEISAQGGEHCTDLDMMPVYCIWQKRAYEMYPDRA